MPPLIVAVIKQVAIFSAVSVVVYFGLAAVLILVGKPGGEPDPAKAPSFGELKLDYGGLPEPETYRARDGAALEYRLYPAESTRTLILLHGSGRHSRYLMPLAKAVAGSGAARVYTPDLRGHGRAPERRGDVDYIRQLTDDLADLIQHIRRSHPGTTIIVGGHSSGGGLAVRFAGSRYGGEASAYVLLAPFLKYNAPTTRPGSGGWARAYTGRIIGLSMLNNVGLTRFNHLPVIDFNMPPEYRDGTETLVYSHRLNTGFAPADYTGDLKAMAGPLLVLAGETDESFYADKYEPTITGYKEARVELLPGAGHLGLAVDPRAGGIVADWLKGLGRQGGDADRAGRP